MKKYILLSFLIWIIIIFFSAFSNKFLCINNQNCFIIKTAESNSELIKWLMDKKTMHNNQGMFFIFKEEKLHTFWMKNTYIPLDIIWFDKSLKIIDIKKNAQPCFKDDCAQYIPKEKAKYVLEINSWLSNKLWINIWQYITYHNININ